MLEAFIKNFKQILKSAFGILDEHYVDDVMHDLSDEIQSRFENAYEVRFVLLDERAAQLKTSALFPTEQTAEEIGRMCVRSRVAIVLVPRK